MLGAAGADALEVHARRVVFAREGEVGVEEFEVSPPAPDEVIIESECSLVSSGTELTVLHRRFEPGTHWERWVAFPFYPGYATVGRVVARGQDVHELSEGDRVATGASHSSHQAVKSARCVRLPSGVESEDAAWFALAKIAFQAAIGAPFELGSSVAIIGAGPVGQMAARWARVAGVRSLILVDPVVDRLAFAEDVVDVAIPTGSTEAGAVLRERGIEPPEVVVDATGRASVLPDALGFVADRGQVVLLGDSGTPSEQRLTGDVLRRRVRLVGVHDSHVVGRWTNTTINSFFLDLLAAGRFDVRGLITHRYAPGEAAAAYERLAAHPAETMGVLFDWRS
jgi:2-desacetyl-2-hydroxyethyl bacteriochlorophyllide A dehydrogenase